MPTHLEIGQVSTTVDELKQPSTSLAMSMASSGRSKLRKGHSSPAGEIRERERESKGVRKSNL